MIVQYFILLFQLFITFIILGVFCYLISKINHHKFKLKTFYWFFIFWVIVEALIESR